MKLLASLLIVLVLINPVLAWSEGGHHIIAVMAFRKLPTDRQNELLRILESNPRFADDFKVPAKVKNRNEWLIGRAGYWPDVVRGVGKEFNRPNWHYELGATNVIGNVANVPAFLGPLPKSATLETKDLHVAQAVELCRAKLRDGSETEKAIALCWLCHLVADLHQPCHAGSLYVESVFPEGDRGANSIPTKQSKNMHALWDGLLGRDFNEGDAQRRIAEINSLGLQPVEISDCKTWLEESRQAARESVYSAEVLEPISVAMRSGSTNLDELQLSEDYLKNAGRVAQVRAWQASARLADVLK